MTLSVMLRGWGNPTWNHDPLHEAGRVQSSKPRRDVATFCHAIKATKANIDALAILSLPSQQNFIIAFMVRAAAAKTAERENFDVFG